MKFESPMGRPWTEAEWERFLRDQRRPATLAPSPDDARLLDELALRPSPAAGPADPTGDETDVPIRDISAYRLARDFALSVREVIEERCRPAVMRETTVRFWSELAAETQRIVQYVVSGHGLGYEDEHICGNIVQCRAALDHAERSIRLLEQQRDGRTGDATLDELLGNAVFVREELERRIDRLRRRVWWDTGGSTA